MKYNEKALEELQIAICKLAVQDYKADKMYKTRHKKRLKLIEGKVERGEVLTNAEKMVLRHLMEYENRSRNAKRFFCSDWGQLLTGVDGAGAIRRIEEQIK